MMPLIFAPGFATHDSTRQNLVIYALFSILLIVIIIALYLRHEKRNREKLRERFVKFSTSYQISAVEKRFSERIRMPDFLKTELMFTEGDYFALKGLVIDISDSGLAIKPDFPLRKIPLQARFQNAILHTTLFDTVLRRISSVRLEHQQNRRLLAFRFEEISPDQQEKILRFLAYLREFLKNEHRKD